MIVHQPATPEWTKSSPPLLLKLGLSIFLVLFAGRLFWLRGLQRIFIFVLLACLIVTWRLFLHKRRFPGDSPERIRGQWKGIVEAVLLITCSLMMGGVCFPYAHHQPEMWRDIPPKLLVPALILAACGTLAYGRFLRPVTTSRIELYFSYGCISLMLLVLSMLALSAFNGMLDIGIARAVTVTVYKKGEEYNKTPTYYLYVNDWKYPGLALRCEVSREQFLSAQAGTQCLLTVKPGAFGAEWIEAIELLSARNAKGGHRN